MVTCEIKLFQPSSTSVWNNIAWNLFKIISQAYCSSWIFSNMFDVAEIISNWFQQLFSGWNNFEIISIVVTCEMKHWNSFISHVTMTLLKFIKWFMVCLQWNRMVSLNLTILVVQRETCLKLKKERFNTEWRQHFYVKGIIYLRNLLDEETVCSAMLNSFKNGVSYYRIGTVYRPFCYILTAARPHRLSQSSLVKPQPGE